MGSMTVCRALSVGSATVVCALVGLGVAAGPASAAASACPKPGAGAIAKAKTATNVGASFSDNANTNTTTYEFFSTNENPVAGVPGLMKYCVYPTTPSTLPTAIHSQAKGFNGASWTAVRGAKNFAFARPDGNKSNVPLDGKTVQMGSAVWTNLPTDQTIVLHVNDAATCRSLYGGTSATCFVRPGLTPCGAGDTTVAYNSVPFDVMACPPLADVGFEATSSSEFGDEVGLTGSGDLKSITVTFRSWGCGDSGHWFSFDCATTPGETFPADSAVNLTAHIYDVASGDAVGSQITSATYAGTIPFRPSANPVKCTNPGTDANGGDDRGKWYDAAANLCLNALPVQITFTFPPGHPAPKPGDLDGVVQHNPLRHPAHRRERLVLHLPSRLWVRLAQRRIVDVRERAVLWHGRRPKPGVSQLHLRRFLLRRWNRRHGRPPIRLPLLDRLHATSRNQDRVATNSSRLTESSSTTRRGLAESTAARSRLSIPGRR